MNVHIPSESDGKPRVGTLARTADEDNRSDIRAVEGIISWSRELPAWVFSLFGHGAILLVFAWISLSTVVPREQVLLDSQVRNLPENRLFSQDDFSGMTNFDDVLGEGVSGMSSLVGDPNDAVEQLNETVSDAQLERPAELEPLRAPEMNAMVRVKGQFAEHTSGVLGAVDRLTIEILRSLEQNQTLVTWIFDASGSLKDQREKIVQRFDRVYSELQSSGRLTDQALLTTVVGFGKNTEFMTPKPIEDLDLIKQAVRSLTVDESGLENVFTAVKLSAKRWIKFRRQGKRNFMIIVFTDEIGDDQNQLESALDITRRNGIPVYVVGIPAVFGRKESYVRWTDPNGESHPIPISQGPETLMVERVNIPFWRGAERSLNQLSSGFGPFALTRLCRETGGIYFIAQRREGPQFNSLELKSYQPDYISFREYQRQLSRNGAWKALVQVAQLNRTKLVVPQTIFSVRNQQALRTALNNAQRDVALLEAQLGPMISILQTGVSDRSEKGSLRWKASFDLAMGRVLSNFVRAREYNFVLATMKQAPVFQNKDSNHWRLVPDSSIQGGARLTQMAVEAKQYLNRVLQQHPNTPWSLIAQAELKQPFGWRLQEYYQYLPPLNQGNGTPSRPANRPKKIPFTLPRL